LTPIVYDNNSDKFPHTYRLYYVDYQEPPVHANKIFKKLLQSHLCW